MTKLDYIEYYFTIQNNNRLPWSIATNIGLLIYSGLYCIGLDYRGLSGINCTLVDYFELFLTSVDYTLQYKYI